MSKTDLSSSKLTPYNFLIYRLSEAKKKAEASVSILMIIAIKIELITRTLSQK